jgi:hypothetical protein
VSNTPFCRHFRSMNWFITIEVLLNKIEQ